MIIIKSDREIALMREAGKVTGEILRELSDFIKPNITTYDINAFVEDKIAHYKMIPTFKGYGGFPAGACVSINEEIVHGIPSKKRILREGDIVSVDTGATYRGYVSDAARTYPVGSIGEKEKKLIDVTRQSFFEGVKYARTGYRLHDIGEAVQKYAESNGMGVIREYLGHGLGKDLHEDPPVPNYKDPGMKAGPHLKRNMVIAIEPMLSLGSYGTRTLDNEWTVITDDRSLSAHYENTVVINDGEPELLTL
ncbi:type I methionyl aminopeptidase [Alterileibacterium massiliense]|uniref:type I methionyl aminopeptidase n=1 Tax=Alterileibacterium massiliense TaxID=1870997 RepID=UPI0008DA3895|nr:type I methionyl aminopeptidase [Alterileibacterium massiliense]